MKLTLAIPYNHPVPTLAYSSTIGRIANRIRSRNVLQHQQEYSFTWGTTRYGGEGELNHHTKSSKWLLSLHFTTINDLNRWQVWYSKTLRGKPNRPAVRTEGGKKKKIKIRVDGKRMLRPRLENGQQKKKREKTLALKEGKVLGISITKVVD